MSMLVKPAGPRSHPDKKDEVGLIAPPKAGQARERVENDSRGPDRDHVGRNSEVDKVGQELGHRPPQGRFDFGVHLPVSDRRGSVVGRIERQLERRYLGKDPSASNLLGFGVRRGLELPAPDDLEPGVGGEPVGIDHGRQSTIKGAAMSPDGQHHLPFGVLRQGRVPAVVPERSGRLRGLGEVLPRQVSENRETAVVVEQVDGVDDFRATS
jgi:hypothetical protein